MNPAFLNPYFLITAVTAACLFAGLGYVYGWQTGMEKYYGYKSKVDAAEEAGRRDAEERQVAMDRVVADVSGAWADALSHARGNPVVRVLHTGCGLRQTGTLPATGLKPPATADEQGLGREILVTIDQCEQRLAYAAQDAAQVLALQDFIKRVHEASK